MARLLVTSPITHLRVVRAEAKPSIPPFPLSRKSFPKDFIFGAGSSSYQYEGAVLELEHGRKPSIWDTFTRKHPEKIADRSNGDVAVDFYHRFKDDVKLIKEMGLDSFRFSLSWSRILPSGRIRDGVNERGVKFYNDLIDELLANGIIPFVTLFHWDVPQALEDDYGGFLSRNIVDDFRDYADLVFEKFGDRVKNWTTLNEPNIFTKFGYVTGEHAPGRCTDCEAGNSGTEPYVAGHHLLLSHAAAIEVYRNKYQDDHKGTIGITISTDMLIPTDKTQVDHQLAAARAMDFQIGWYLDPVVYGKYPDTMRSLLGRRLPEFTKEESESLKQSFDFIGCNYYTGYYATPSTPNELVPPSYTTDSHASLSSEKNGVPIGEPTFLSWLNIYPEGIADVLHYITKKYNNPYILITENGMADENRGSLLADQKGLDDNVRIRYHSEHLSYVLKAMKEGANVGGYYAWTLLDDFEWGSGYTPRFGIIFVDYENGLKRHPKDSYYWFKNFLAK